ncbi:MAG: hypothetical protein JXA73_07735 [Acidobacteria bacterium]|nr:hypothetical protein [Acidobacteriota bacterium]
MNELDVKPFANAVIPPSDEHVTKTIADQIIGTWVLVEAHRLNTSSQGLISFTGTHWITATPDPKTGLVVYLLGGRYILEGDIMTERIDFADESMQSVIGGAARIKITMDGDVFKQIDLDRGIYNQTWKRYKPTQPSTRQDRK